MRWLHLLLVGSCLATAAYALSCIPCGSSPCETPQCCESGSYTKDVCGCCDVCAEAKGSGCGGPWGIEGTCAYGLSCHRKCRECVTLSGKSCIFPYKYKGVEYNNCTSNDSADPWCALVVDEFNEVIPGKWEDCALGCPGTEQECTSGDLFNAEGRCISNVERSAIEESMKGRTMTQQVFDNGASENRPAAFCNLPDSKKCKCDEDGCQKPSWVEEGFDSSWCFLKYVQDPSNPTNNCFKDIFWSSSHGKFWSTEACRKNGNSGSPPFPAPPSPPPPPQIIIDGIESTTGNLALIEIEDADGTPLDEGSLDEVAIEVAPMDDMPIGDGVASEEDKQEDEVAPPAPPPSADRILPPAPPPPSSEEEEEEQESSGPPAPSSEEESAPPAPSSEEKEESSAPPAPSPTTATDPENSEKSSE